MKIDKTTYKDRREKQIGMIAVQTYQPNKFYFFLFPIFLHNSSCTKHTHIFCDLSKPPQRTKKQCVPKQFVKTESYICDYKNSTKYASSKFGF